MRKLLLLSLFAIFCALLNAEAPPPNLVVNGGFETGDFTGWTTHACTGDCSDAGWRIDGGAFAGSVAAVTLCVGAPCNDRVNVDTLKQTLPTGPSQLYSLTFAYNAGEDSGCGETTALNVYWNGALVQSLVNVAAGYHVYTLTGLTPGGTGTVLEFTGRQDPATLFLDAISVVASGPGSYIGAFYK